MRTKVRHLLGDSVSTSGIALSGSIDLRAGSGGLGSGYEQGCIFSRMYPHGEALNEHTLLSQARRSSLLAPLAALGLVA